MPFAALANRLKFYEQQARDQLAGASVYPGEIGIYMNLDRAQAHRTDDSTVRRKPLTAHYA